MNVKRFPVILLMLVAVGVVLSGCASLVSSGPKSSPTPTAEVSAPAQPVSEAPDAVVEAFYTWYLDYIGDRASGEMRNPLVDGAYRSSEYLTDALIGEVDELVASGARYDPFLCAQDIPETFGVEEAQVAGDEATVVLHQIWNADTEFASTRDLTIELRQVDGEWKIDDVTCPDPESAGAAPANPAVTVEAFYAWYLDYSETGNPMADEAYRSSEYLTEAFVQKVDELIASFDRGGYDPFLCAQDVPQDISVAEMNFSGDEAQVEVQTSFEGHSFKVLLQREGDQWKIADVVCASPGDEGTVEIEPLVDLARADLAQRLGIDLETVVIQGVEPTEFPDASLGVREPDRAYAQVVTPGCVIQLSVNDDIYVYHAAEGRAVLVSEEGESKKGTPGASPLARNEIAIGQSTLTFKMPTDWVQRGSEWVWVPVRGGERRFGVNVSELEPPMELEAALLPKPAQIVASEPVELDWAQSARSFTLKVYGPASQGDDEKASVEAVQRHVLAMVQEEGQRTGIDFYVSAASTRELSALELLLESVLRSTTLTKGR